MEGIHEYEINHMTIIGPKKKKKVSGFGSNKSHETSKSGEHLLADSKKGSQRMHKRI